MLTGVLSADAWTLDIGPQLSNLLEYVVVAWLIVRTETANRKASKVQETTEEVMRETKPNGGSSLRDALDAVHRRLDAMGLPGAPMDRSGDRSPDND